MSEGSTPGPNDRSRTATATSDDGVLSIRLQVRPSGLVVQRTELGRDGRRVVQSLHFTDAPAFDRWCESDDLRFAYPLFFSKLARSGRELLGTDS